MAAKKDATTEKSEDAVISVTALQLAEKFRVTRRYVDMLGDDGICVKTGRGRYDLIKSMENYILKLKSEKSEKETPIESVKDLKEVQARHEQIKSQISELKLEVMKGKLFEDVDIERAMSEMLIAFKDKMLALPSKLAPRIIAMTNEGDIETELNVEIRDALTELSEYDPEKFKSDKAIDTEEESDD